MAYNPQDGYIYILGANTQTSDTFHLQRIDTASGAVTSLSSFNVNTGTQLFGALWFDNEGNVYASQNSSGAIWKVSTEAPYTATFMFNGPVTTGNDGARCPAPVVTTVNISGKIWHDEDQDAILNGSEEGINPDNLHANLVNQETGLVVRTVLVDSVTGGYFFEDVSAVGIYQVIITNNPTIPNSTILTNSEPLPGNWEYTGTNVFNNPNVGDQTGIIANIVTNGQDVTGLDFGIVLTTPVGIQYGFFTAEVEHMSTILKWQTLSEHSNKGFELERSNDGKRWVTIGFVPTQANNGTSGFKLNYQFADKQPMVGKNYYRLKQVDIDGQSTYSPVRVVTFAGGKTSIYPNPTHDKVIISGLTGTERITLFDMTGNSVMQIKASGAETTLLLNDLAAGVYQIHISDVNEKKSVMKLIKQ